MPGEPSEGRSSDARTNDDGAIPKLSPLPVLPGASQSAHVTISGGPLGGLDVVRVDDTTVASPGKVEVGARVELRDGRDADVVDVRGKLLSKFGVREGTVTVRLDDGEVHSTSGREISRVIAPPPTAQSGT
jgi:hypothetical protein